MLSYLAEAVLDDDMEVDEETGKKKHKGPIRWGMLIAVLVFLCGGAGGFYLYRNALIQASVVMGGRQAFLSETTLDGVNSWMRTSTGEIKLGRLQIPDRNDLSKNLIDCGSFEAKISPRQLLLGKLQVDYARATDVALFKTRETPATALGGEVQDPEAGAAAAAAQKAMVDRMAKELAKILGLEGVNLLDVPNMTLDEILTKADVKTYKVAKQLPGKAEAEVALWEAKVKALQEKVKALRARTAERTKRLQSFGGQAQREWTKALNAKRATFNTLEADLKKNPKACGPNPSSDIPKRVNKELKELEAQRQRILAQGKQLRVEASALVTEVNAVQKEAQALRAGVDASRSRIEAEIAALADASEQDLDRIRKAISSASPGDQLMRALVAGIFGERAAQALDNVEKIKAMIPPEVSGLVPPKSLRDGITVAFFPEDASPAARASVHIKDLEVTGKIYLSEGRVAEMSGHIFNLSSDPRETGELGFKLECKLEGETFVLEGTCDPKTDRVRMSLSWDEFPLERLKWGEAPKVLPRIKSGKAKVTLSVDSTPSQLELAFSATVKDLEWIEAAADADPLVSATHEAVKAVKALSLTAGVKKSKGQSPQLSIEDRSETKLVDVFGGALAKVAQAEVEKQVKKHEAAINELITKQVALAKGKLGPLGPLASSCGEADSALAGDSKALKGGASPTLTGSGKLKSEATTKLLAAATRGRFKLPSRPKNPFGD
ncbi:MAG: DUF748 domain-containing protein [Planctomycetes bacterium]|nr:DUF748 domain-containing protein [Planctomycetota bacterium]